MWPLPEPSDQQKRDALMDPQYLEMREWLGTLSPAVRAAVMTAFYVVSVTGMAWRLLTFRHRR